MFCLGQLKMIAFSFVSVALNFEITLAEQLSEHQCEKDWRELLTTELIQKT